MNRMSCSMTRTAMPWSRMAKTSSSVARGLLGVHAQARGLVQEQQPRLAGQRAGDLQLALLAVGQVAGEVVGLGGEAYELQELHGAFAGGGLGRCGSRDRAAAADQKAFLVRVWRPTRTFSSDRHVAEQPDVLEGAGDAGCGG